MKKSAKVLIIFDLDYTILDNSEGIGDHIHDRELAELIGGIFFGVMTGYCTKEQLIKGQRGKIIIIDDLSSLTTQFIQQLVSHV
ncbi:MAG: hypothetical protein R6U96_15500 [Promethearchaeia archaeon]